MKRRRKKRSWSKEISKFIAQEVRANRRKSHKRPWRQVVKIGLERARKAGLHVPSGKHIDKFNRQISHEVQRHSRSSQMYDKLGDPKYGEVTRQEMYHPYGSRKRK